MFDDDKDIMMDRRERRVEKRTLYRETPRLVLGRFHDHTRKDYWRLGSDFDDLRLANRLVTLARIIVGPARS